MTRFFLTIVLPLLLPTALYLLWAVRFGRAAAPTSRWRAWPWSWLVLSGLVLAAVVLVVVAETSGSRNGTYVPPHLVDGSIVPGHVVPPAAPR